MNFWQEPKTTAVGILTAAALVCNTLSQQGVRIGHVGTSDWVTLGAALAAALLGALARDPVKK
jgi:hypothetical protein